MKTSTEIFSTARIVGYDKAIKLIGEAGFDAFDSDIVEAIATLAKFVPQDRLQQISVACEKTTLKISINTKGQVKITRTEKKAVAAEC